MKTNKILMGGLAGALTFFLLGWLVYGVLLAGYAEENYNHCASRPMEEMIWWAIILSNLAYGFLLAIVCSWANTKGWMAGAQVAGLTGLLIGLSINLSMHAMNTMFNSIGAMIVDIVVYAIISSVTGIVIALVFGMSKKEV
ncbi:MAG: hypothetical protein ISR55_13055 [Bacteroidetes bacterium]|nr:hypothetical protein [Bacteroidota bacterium]